MTPEQATAEHQWLRQLVGKWNYESEFRMGPDQPLMKNTGIETVRSLGEFWTVGEGESELPDYGPAHTIITLGYNPKSQRFVGTFVASMMSFLWSYQGTLSADRRVLTLDAEGPNFLDGGMAKYQDIIEIVSPDHRIMRSQVLQPDGSWVQFMTAHYRRLT